MAARAIRAAGEWLPSPEAHALMERGAGPSAPAARHYLIRRNHIVLPASKLGLFQHRLLLLWSEDELGSDLNGDTGAWWLCGAAVGFVFFTGISDSAMSDSDRRNGGRDGPGTGVVVKTRTKTRKPAMYKVLMLNDDYTPMEFVVHVLERFFQKSRDEATRIMLHVHRRGVGVCGVFTYEVAETKVTQVMDLARQNQHPLQCTIEKE
jgi:ATP-dependent Clp protease adaptor protein ClpS